MVSDGAAAAAHYEIQACLVHLHLCAGGIHAHNGGHTHLGHGLFFFRVFPLYAQIRQRIVDGVGHHEGGVFSAVVGDKRGGIQQHQHRNLRVICRGKPKERRDILLLFLFIAHANALVFLAGAGFAAHMVPGHIGIFAMALFDTVFQHGADGVADILTDYLPLDDRFNVFHHISVCIQNLFHNMRLQKLAAVHHRAGSCNQRNGCHRGCLAICTGRKLYHAHVFPRDRLGKGFVIHINPRAL